MGNSDKIYEVVRQRASAIEDHQHRTAELWARLVEVFESVHDNSGMDQCAGMMEAYAIITGTSVSSVARLLAEHSKVPV